MDPVHVPLYIAGCRTRLSVSGFNSRQEPYAVILHVRILLGLLCNWHSYRDYTLCVDSANVFTDFPPPRL